jgi:hypothetical protein
MARVESGPIAPAFPEFLPAAAGAPQVIKHIVMWRIAGASPGERSANADRVCSCFMSLKTQIPGLLHLEVGLDRSRVEYACDVVLYTEFESPQALAAYATHPEHERVKGELSGLRTTRHQVDYVPFLQP